MEEVKVDGIDGEAAKWGDEKGLDVKRGILKEFL